MNAKLDKMNPNMPLEERITRMGAGWMAESYLTLPFDQLDDIEDANGTTPLEHGQNNWKKYQKLFGPTSSTGTSDTSTASVQEIKLTIQGDGKIMVMGAPPGLAKAAEAFNDEVTALMYPRPNSLNQKRG